MAIAARCVACGAESEGPTCDLCGASLEADDAATRDATAASRDRAAERRDRGAASRDERARRHDEQASDRERLAAEQDQMWSDEDEAASNRDQRSADIEQLAADDVLAAGGDAAAHADGFLARAQASRQRDTASALRNVTTASRQSDPGAGLPIAPLPGDRERAIAANDREDAAEDREGAAVDRVEAAEDREEAARERAVAVRNSISSAGAAQRALETLESMSDAFFTLDSDWRFMYLNPKTEAILERERDDLVGRSIWEELPWVVGSRFEVEYRRAVREGVPVRFEERSEASGRTFEVRAFPVTAGLAVYFTDVTEQRQRDARLQQTERLEMLGQLTAGVAHDFNNLLAAVGGFAQLGQAEDCSERVAGYFDRILTASDSAAALTGQLLAFGRQQVLSPAAVDLNEAVDTVSSLLRQLLPAGVTLQLDLCPHPVPVFVDPSQLGQVVLNLVVNGRDAIEQSGSITVRTSTAVPAGVVHDCANPCGWIQVTDTGTGIPEDVRAQIFDPFFTTKAVGTGTGLGLATIYGIVSQSGGAIFVDSAVGEGTTMTVALPVGQQPAVTEPGSEATLQGS